MVTILELSKISKNFLHSETYDTKKQADIC